MRRFDISDHETQDHEVFEYGHRWRQAGARLRCRRTGAPSTPLQPCVIGCLTYCDMDLE